MIEIGNKPTSIEEVQGQYMGLLKFTKNGWAEIVHIRDSLAKKQKDKIHMTGILQMVIDSCRQPILAIPYLGVWGEIDSAEDLKIYSQASELRGNSKC